ncbi:MAG: hypothetical protein JXA69_04740 [Phycisphaerae bacterium]|nr:hypothetical protein [Phycisphaerae bacterium]
MFASQPAQPREADLGCNRAAATPDAPMRGDVPTRANPSAFNLSRLHRDPCHPGSSLSSRYGWRRILCAAAFVLVTAAPARANTAPVADDIDELTAPSTVSTITLSGDDDDGDTLSYVITSLPSEGTLEDDGATISSGDLPYAIPSNGTDIDYISDEDTHGDITFTYKADDGTDTSTAATVTVSVNQEPAGTDATASTPPDEDVKITLTGSDDDGDTLTFTIVTLPGHGTLAAGSTTLTASDLPCTLSSADVTYTPDEAFHGPDAFTFEASDDWETSSDVATITIYANTEPTVESFRVFAPPGDTQTITLLGNDADRDPISYVLLSLPAHGLLKAETVTITSDMLPYTIPDNGCTVTYGPVAGYLGTDSFHYEVTDGFGTSTLGVIGLTINTPPVGVSSEAVTDTAGQAAMTLLPTDADGDTLTISFTALPSQGRITAGGAAVSDTGTTFAVGDAGVAVVYQVNYDYSGTDTFSWQVSDGKDTGGPYTVSITIPIAVPTPETPPPADTTSSDDTSGSGDSTNGSEDDSTELTNPEVDPCGDMGFFGMAILFATTGLGAMSTGRRRRTCGAGRKWNV